MLDPRADLEELLRRDRDEILGLCQELVRIPSENPPGETTAIVDRVVDYLEGRQLSYEVVAPQAHMPNLVATQVGSRGGRRLVLNGHLDTFPSGDPSLWSENPFSGVVRDGKLFGRGVADMKVGCTASLLTFLYLSSLRDHWDGMLTLSLVSDEETFGPWGTRYLMENHPAMVGDCTLSGEPNMPSTVRVGEKGFLWLELQVAGTGGHGAYGGKSAIKQAVTLLRELEDIGTFTFETPPDVLERIEAARGTYDRELGAGSTDALLKVTVNPGIIQGGTKINMVASHCRVEFDIRCPIGVPTDVILSRFRDVVTRYPEASCWVINCSEPNYCSPDHELVRLVQDNAQRLLGIRPLPSIGLGATDCRLWRHRGMPAVVYGPTPHNMGAPDEYVTLDDLFNTVWVHVLTAFDYLSAGNNW